MCVEWWERALWLSWVLQKAGPGGREIELPPCFTCMVFEGFHKDFPAFSLGCSGLL